MSIPLGDLTEDQTTDFKFFTHAETPPAPITLVGGVVSVYKANNTTQSTAGVTLTVDFDGITGTQHVRIDTSASVFYAVGNDYQVVLTAGTVDGVSVVGAVLAHFSIENRFDKVDVTKLVGVAQSAADLKDFADAGYDPATKKVEGVKLVDLTTTNGDMRGTDGANTTTPAVPGDAMDLITDAVDAAALSTDAVAEIWSEIVDGTLTARDALAQAKSMGAGKIRQTGSSPDIFEYFNDAGTVKLFTITFPTLTGTLPEDFRTVT